MGIIYLVGLEKKETREARGRNKQADQLTNKIKKHKTITPNKKFQHQKSA